MTYVTLTVMQSAPQRSKSIYTLAIENNVQNTDKLDEKYFHMHTKNIRDRLVHRMLISH